ncbi:MAG: HD domain-containing protein [Rhodocyclaceae bacterium]|nr:HD domain-containing protein [Planctomycetota bacterium]MCX8016287.1 HD domain-containing protein [Rhodocyclaceae bacterium]
MNAHPTAAVIDCGTSAVRALLVELRGDEVRVLEDIVRPVALGEGLTGGKLSHDTMSEVISAIRDICAAMRTYGIARVRAVATSGVRESANGDILIERVRAATGIQLEAIDGAEEARLYYAALLRLLARERQRLPNEALMIEIGGGGTVLGHIRKGALVRSSDEHYGTVRVIERFACLRDSSDYAVSIERDACGAARMMLVRYPTARLRTIYANGGDVRRLLALIAPSELSIAPLSASALRAWYREMRTLSRRARAERCGCDEREADLLLPAAAVLMHICAVTDIEEVLVTRTTLRDGLVADLLPGSRGPHYLDRERILAEAHMLVERFGGNIAYAENTASLAVQIFDQTKALHGLGERERLLLEFAAWVHDIGAYINVRERHKHTLYILSHTDIAGLNAEEKQLVAQIARYHRRSPPEPHHEGFQALDRRHKVVVVQLASILRLAYALDVEREQRIRRLRCEIAPGRLLIRVDRRQIALERVALADKKQMFEEAFGLAVDILPREGE